MAKFSANLGFLWRDQVLVERVRSAAAAGFSAVECHWPYEVPAAELRAVLEEAGLPMLSINTTPGDSDSGEFGLCSLPDKIQEARDAIEQAVDYAHNIDARHVHVMAGLNAGCERGRDAYLENLAHAAAAADSHGIGILIEPLNHRDVPNYFLNGFEQAVEIVETVGAPNLRIMFDCYHLQIMQGDLMNCFEAGLQHIGHVQIASVPDRHEPDEGELSFERLIPFMDRCGYEGFIGAEYHPRRGTDEGLGWLRWFSAA